MTGESKYHLSEHRPGELLGPIEATLWELEQRAKHYLNHIPLQSAENAKTLDAARAAIAQARAEIHRALAASHPDSGETTSEHTSRKRILITGAAGGIGSALAKRLCDSYALRLMYHRNVPAEPPVSDFVVANTSRIDDIAAAMEGMDAVVHMAADPHTRGPWESMLENNIIGTYNVFEAARLAGVKRIVFASTNHVMGMYDRDRQWPIYASQPIRPDSLYGVSKAFGEALGRFWHDQHGISVICLRIGWMTPEPRDDISRWMWLSPRDCAQVVSRALDSDLGFGVFYAISANSGRHWDITETIERLGYRPEDDAERYFAGSGD